MFIRAYHLDSGQLYYRAKKADVLPLFSFHGAGCQKFHKVVSSPQASLACTTLAVLLDGLFYNRNFAQ
ncbi:MAG: hypothetical protein LBS53_10125, partial [Synergistaceae bacterium]|nr:hypothetical protein [Synergistaceae bacterium]